MQKSGTRSVGADFVARAVQFRQVLRDSIAKENADCSVSLEAIEASHQAGFLEMVQPTAFGSYEVDYDVFANVIYELTLGSPSNAWVCFVLAEYAWLIGAYPEEVQQLVWSADPRTLAPRPAQRVSGSLMLHGGWPFSSACDHAQWVIVGAMVSSDDGSMSQYAALVPMSEVEIVDDWQMLGLRGAGSKTLPFCSAFVPDNRALLNDMAMSGLTPKAELYPDSYLFRAPRGLLATYTFTPVTLAIAERMLGEAVSCLIGRGVRGPKPVDDPILQISLAVAAAEIELAGARLLHGFGERGRYLKAGKEFSQFDVAENGRDVAFLVRRLRQASDTILKWVGLQWVYERHPLHYLNHLARDLWTASTHRIANWTAYEAAMLQRPALVS